VIHKAAAFKANADKVDPPAKSPDAEKVVAADDDDDDDDNGAPPRSTIPSLNCNVSSQSHV